MTRLMKIVTVALLAVGAYAKGPGVLVRGWENRDCVGQPAQKVIELRHGNCENTNAFGSIKPVHWKHSRSAWENDNGKTCSLVVYRDVDCHDGDVIANPLKKNDLGHTCLTAPVAWGIDTPSIYSIMFDCVDTPPSASSSLTHYAITHPHETVLVGTSGGKTYRTTATVNLTFNIQAWHTFADLEPTPQSEDVVAKKDPAVYIFRQNPFDRSETVCFECEMGGFWKPSGHFKCIYATDKCIGISTPYPPVTATATATQTSTSKLMVEVHSGTTTLHAPPPPVENLQKRGDHLLVIMKHPTFDREVCADADHKKHGSNKGAVELEGPKKCGDNPMPLSGYDY